MAHPLFSRCPTASASSRRLFQSIPKPSSILRQSRPLHLHSQPSHSRTTSRSQRLPRYTSIPKSPYHSQHHPDLPTHEYSNSQTTILSAALTHVPTHGFTPEALTLGARDAGFLDVSVQLFPRGEFDLVLFWLASRRGLLRAKVESGLFKDEHSVDEKTKILIMERLRMNAGIKHQWQDALALMSLAGNIPFSLSELHALSSEILTLAGDKSVDSAWYTKRLSVSAIYASSEVFSTRDSTPELSETQAFLNRRFEDNKTIGDKITGVTECLGFMGSTAVGLGRSWGLKI